MLINQATRATSPYVVTIARDAQAFHALFSEHVYIHRWSAVLIFATVSFTTKTSQQRAGEVCCSGCSYRVKITSLI